MKKHKINPSFFVFGEKDVLKMGILPSVSTKEKGKSYLGRNVLKHNLVLYKVDDGLIKESNTTKNDRLLLTFGNQYSAYFIEFKGSDIKQGCIQIEQSISQLKTKLENFTIFARLICSKADLRDLNHEVVIRLKKELRNRVIIKQKRLEEDLK